MHGVAFTCLNNTTKISVKLTNNDSVCVRGQGNMSCLLSGMFCVSLKRPLARWLPPHTPKRDSPTYQWWSETAAEPNRGRTHCSHNSQERSPPPLPACQIWLHNPVLGYHCHSSQVQRKEKVAWGPGRTKVGARSFGTSNCLSHCYLDSLMLLRCSRQVQLEKGFQSTPWLLHSPFQSSRTAREQVQRKGSPIIWGKRMHSSLPV